MKASFFFALFFVAICNNVLCASIVEKERTSGNEGYHRLKRAKHDEHMKLLDDAHNYLVKQNVPVNLEPVRLKVGHKISKHTQDLFDLRMGTKLPGTKTAKHVEDKKYEIRHY